jgi:general secretion pathway protein G
MMIRQPQSTTHALHRAFTLVEVLAVMAILVIIAGAGAFGIVKYMDLAKEREAKLKMQKIENAAKIFFSNNSTFPNTPDELIQSADGTAPLLEGGQAAIMDPWGQPFQMQITQDQFGSTRVLLTSVGGPKQITWPQN